MITRRRTHFILLWMLRATALAAPVFAQQAPASSASTAMPEMDMGSMPGMDMLHAQHVNKTSKPATPARATSAQPAAASSSMGGMSGMDMGAIPGMDRSSTSGMPGMKTSHGQHSAPAASSTSTPAAPVLPPGPADPAAYLAKLEAMPMTGMDMADNPRFGKLLINQLEATRANGASGQAWDAYAWYGTDFNKLAIRTEGDRAGGRVEAGDIEALWSHAIAALWDTELGVRHDFGIGPDRDWAAFGVQGIAPYWFDIEATGYVGAGGRTAARFKAEYELLFTQRLILQPEFEANLYGRRDPARGLGSGLSDASLGLRLRYEIRREFAPYIGVVWQRVFGGTAGFRRAENKSVFDRQIVAGVRVWF
ncbi:copper resistance protein B [Metallibacterium sp.]